VVHEHLGAEPPRHPEILEQHVSREDVGRAEVAERSVASAGDVNGDGYADVIVGEEGDTMAYIYLGGPAGTSTSPATTLGPSYAGGFFGGSVAGAGDVNGDGYADVIVGEPLDPGLPLMHGRAYVYLGGPGGTSTSPATTLGPSLHSFGASVASAGDVNGDGYADVIVGEPDDAMAYVYLGGSAGTSISPATTLGPSFTGDDFGLSVAGAGDVNGDGYADVIVGEYVDGRAYLYLGGAGSTSTQPATTLVGNGDFGTCVY
jgi:glycerol uptake facilitator-like aquaporin